MVSSSIIRKAATEFPDMERKYRSAIMKFNMTLDEMWEQRQAQQQVQVIQIDDSQTGAFASIAGISIQHLDIQDD